MGFFETQEDGYIIYCYEPEEGGPYLLATDELGEGPKPGAPITIACYSPEDVFLWGREFKNIGLLQELYEQSNKGKNFFAALQQKHEQA